EAGRYAAFLTPQAPSEPTPLTAVPSAAELSSLPGVVEAGVNYAVGETPNSQDGSRGGTLARLVAVADRPESLVELSASLAGDGYFSYAGAGGDSGYAGSGGDSGYAGSGGGHG
ncbi:MAG TPA: hypothetical protein VFU36_00240, partial [Jatrophihabitans sp.]|nr:hypothetical protein [Jatrophihabitans sp.]